ncbi:MULTISPECIES: MobF family relaxase [Sphingobium]|jgi:conjugative relaxase-like TrwC/TraI family protein|uniref:Relaxase domain-containing protein n=3 Tax=Sphingobium TaxID=165695 RepID=A0A6P1GEG9_SPHYA|nr:MULTISPECIES: MobF family relaxase [Sphingobium]EQB16570.1 TrwC protein [Sphingobium lactosutens DS20]QDC36683.1 conjugative relaxase [Sphingobium fuliginis ATCC 27551]QHD66778.1 relaxase domain-containing protein [Sphingobium yanoikuyae]QNG43831.1 relaxase domain-containing protein [Sphingobium yanoikuyae]
MINPIRLKGKPANIARYYTVGDYYTKGDEEHSEWGGKIAAELGLEGEVDPAVFKELLAGKVGDQQLGRRRKDGEIQHHPGWDFAVNAPKSVSIMALVAGDDRIIEAHEQAVGVALAYLEEHATMRHRVDGEVTEKTTGRLIWARFTEHASRELDPHLHTHVVVMNITDERDGAKKVSLETRAMFAEQMAAGQVYRNELAHLLRERGYDVEFDPRRGLFEIRGVPKDLITDMSQRAEQIEAHAKEHGLTGQAARQQSFYATRGPKQKASLEELHQRWDGRLGQHAEAVKETRADAEGRGERPLEVDPATAARAMLFGIRQSESKEAVNNLGRLLQTAMASHVGEVRLADVRPVVEEHQERAKLLETRHRTGDEIHTRGRTTRKTARLELALSDQLALALNDARPLASVESLRDAGLSRGLKPEQRTALLHIGMSDHRVVAVHGVAGSGKSTIIRALREAVGEETTLIALAPTSSAAGELGLKAGIESRTVASLLATGGVKLDDSHVLVVDEAGQLGNRQAMRLLEISRATGARLILLGDTRQTGAIEQGKPFWLMMRLGMPRAELKDPIRQEAEGITKAVRLARLQNYDGSLGALDKVVSGDSSEKLAEAMVGDWTRLTPDQRAKTNMLVLENATRLIVNTKVREALKTEGAIAAEETRLSILSPSGMTDQEKHFARFYTRGQVVTFSRDNVGLGIARDAEYKVAGVGRDARGRQTVNLVDEHGRMIQWDPRLGRASQINVFQEEKRDLAAGDRIQWRLVNKDLELKNAERGTVERLDGAVATIRWDRDGRSQEVDLSQYKNWDHGYGETVYSAQSKTYDRVYVLAPVNSPLVTGQNYYTAITRARFGASLWTENRERLVEKLKLRSGEKTSSLQGLGRVERDNIKGRRDRHSERWDRLREEQRSEREARKEGLAAQREPAAPSPPDGLAERIAHRAQSTASFLDRWIISLLDRSSQRENGDVTGERSGTPTPQPVAEPQHTTAPDHGGGHDR